MFWELSSLSRSSKGSVNTKIQRKGLMGHPCLIPIDASKMADSLPASDYKNSGALYIDIIVSTMGAGIPSL
jgi:hypothetical protein